MTDINKLQTSQFKVLCNNNVIYIIIMIYILHFDAGTPILQPPDAKSWLIWKDSDAGKDWRHEEKGTTEDEMLDGITNSMDMSLSKL